MAEIVQNLYNGQVIQHYTKDRNTDDSYDRRVLVSCIMGKGYITISKDIPSNPKRVLRALRRKGVHQTRMAELRKKWRANLDKQIKKAYTPNVTEIKKLAADYGLSQYYIISSLRRSNVRIINPNKPPTQRIIELDAKIKKLYVPGESLLKDIGQKLGCSYNVVSKRLKANNIKYIPPPFSYSERQFYRTLATQRGVDVKWIMKFKDIKKIKTLNKYIRFTEGRRGRNFAFTPDQYMRYIEKFYNDPMFNKLLTNHNSDKQKKPSLDHIVPLSKGGTHDPDNLQFITFFENRAKWGLSQEQWDAMKSHIHDYLT